MSRTTLDSVFEMYSSSPLVPTGCQVGGPSEHTSSVGEVATTILGGFAGAEAYHIHRPFLDRIKEYDPRVGTRVVLGKDFSASDYLTLGDLRAVFMREVAALAAPYDAMLMPTVPCVRPSHFSITRYMM